MMNNQNDYIDMGDINIQTNNTVKTPKKTNKKPVNKKKIVTVAAIVGGALLIGAVGVAVVPKVLTKNNQHITLATPKPSNLDIVGEDVTEVVNTTDIGTDTNINKVVKREEPYDMTPNDNVISANTVVTLPITVNAKLEGDEEYNDYYTYLTFKFNDATIGYDNVIPYVNEHNETSNNIVNIGTREEFYASAGESELVMYEAELTIPEDFVTQDTEHKRAYINPQLTFNIEGTEEANSLITTRYVYEIPQVTNMHDDMSQLTCGETYKFRWLAVIPTDITSDNYNIYISYKDDYLDTTYKYNGITIVQPSETENVKDEEADIEQTVDNADSETTEQSE